MILGKFKVDAVETGLFSLDGGAMFGVVPKALWAKAYHPGDELNRIPLAARPLLIQYDNKKILVDTGNGNKFNDKLIKIYGIDKEKSSIVGALKPFNINPEDITHVILTHLHFDHSGGATILNNNVLAPTFPNAKYFVQKEQLLWAKSPTEKDRGSYYPENYDPLIAEGMLETIDGEGEILPGISVITLDGHTKAMQIVKLSDGDESLLFCADLIATSAHIHVPFVMGYDNNPLIAIEEKRRIIPQAYEEKTIIVFEHDAFMQAGTLKSTEKGFSIADKIVLTETS